MKTNKTSQIQGKYLAAAIAALALTGCAGTQPQLGGGGTVATGAAGGANAANASSQLEKCDKPLGTLGVVEDQSAPWYHALSQYKLGSTVPVLRMMIQQSNCFVVVERGAALKNMNMERDIQQSGEMRAGSTKGDVVAAARAVLGDKLGRFVPGHPIAGRETNGPDAAIPNLYQGKKVVLTPPMTKVRRWAGSST
eukprot:gene43019-53383_t